MSIADEINSLPQHLRDYIHELITNADPAGEKLRLLQLEENVTALMARIGQLTYERDRLQFMLRSRSSPFCSTLEIL